ncbi:MAG: response regulator [Planctomycetota bacterium]
MTGKARVLVVDDEVNLLKTLSDVLNRNGYEVAVAKDGPSALGLIEKNGFDIALLGPVEDQVTLAHLATGDGKRGVYRP